jgi:hypothetical protein
MLLSWFPAVVGEALGVLAGRQVLHVPYARCRPPPPPPVGLCVMLLSLS